MKPKKVRPGAVIAYLLILALVLMVSCSGKKEVKRDEVFDPEKSLARGTDLIERKQYEEARKVLLEVKNRDFTKKYAPLAQLKIADSYVRDEEYEAAAQEYRRFLDIYPDHKDASYAQYQIAMTYFVQIESPERGYGAAEKAMEEFEKIKRMFPRNPYREVIDLRIEKCRNTIADYEFLVAEFYFKKGSYNAALGRYKLLSQKFPDYNKESMVLYHSALCYKKLGNKDKAVESLNRLIEKYPDDRLVKDAKKELASLGKQ
ncbi:MAG: outer membrane protein assembly factor BamD [Nitrospirae bacterium]|nr:outer membrane protein assembly factor BamD [Nitrospirota bacterium]